MGFITFGQIYPSGLIHIKQFLIQQMQLFGITSDLLFDPKKKIAFIETV